MSNDQSVRRVIDLFQRTMWLRDPGIIYLVLATIVANLLPGDPLWLLIIGPPSSGKTEALAALSKLSWCHFVSTLSEAGLLSGSPKRVGSSATGGLLRQIGERGVMVFSDFGTVLNEHSSTRNRLFALLREVFDGMLVRLLGTDGGRRFFWEGHCGFIGASTEAIDSPSIDLGLLGERLNYYRIPTSTPEDDFMACEIADNNAGHQRAIRDERSRAVAEFIIGLTIPSELPPLSEAERVRLITLATIAAVCRSAVVRDGHSREIELVPGHERPPRLHGQLRQLHAALVVIGTPEAEVWRLLAKVALDGIHPGRRAVLDYLIAEPAEHSTSSIAGHCRLTQTPTRRHLQDLTAHGAVDLVGDDPERWCTSEWLSGSWWAVTGKREPNSVAELLSLFPGAEEVEAQRESS
jgi:hypothetical protein